ncbi:alkyl/aryl-sulfatase [Streptomyces sp. NPDC092307]|uniref:alkyl/aryl-sulfatase n=1 Tax=Streptomyces sp. NPDC092307 TaxID=3366013 RepID=UPI0038237886
MRIAMPESCCTKKAKPATKLTEMLNAAVEVPHEDLDPEFELARRGLIEALPADFTVEASDGRTVWSLSEYSNFLFGAAPSTVNPSLWRNAKLNMNTGLYEVVADAVYQIRGMDMSNITFLEDPMGISKDIVVVDPLVSAECARVALALYRRHRGEDRTIAAVVYTHSHVDHFGGVRGLFGDDGPDPNVQFIAPDGFMEHAVSENVYAGNAMSTRAVFMYGMALPKSPQGQVDAGLGKTNSTGTVGLIEPTVTIAETTPAGHPVKFGPINFEFQLTPDTEAPAEMNFYLPDIRALCVAENANATMHNLYSLRGAKVRDGKSWSVNLHATAELYGPRSSTLFASHFWPRWKTFEGDEIVEFLTSQADLYRYLHDQTLRLANLGETIIEVGEKMVDSMPESLTSKWFNRGYYGTTNHNSKGVYQRYLGWFDGNPAHLHTLPPEEAGPRYVQAMGGARQVVDVARKAFTTATTQQDYRWAAEILSHVVFSDPANIEARELAADILEQLGYQAESGPWRNFYIGGADELRNRPANQAPVPSLVITQEIIEVMPLEMLFDYLAIRLNGPRSDDQRLTIGLNITDGIESDPAEVTVLLENSVLHYVPRPMPADADAIYDITRAGLNGLTLGETNICELLFDGQLTVSTGTIAPLTTLLGFFDTFNMNFGVATP